MAPWHIVIATDSQIIILNRKVPKADAKGAERISSQYVTSASSVHQLIHLHCYFASLAPWHIVIATDSQIIILNRKVPKADAKGAVINKNNLAMNYLFKRKERKEVAKGAVINKNNLAMNYLFKRKERKEVAKGTAINKNNLAMN